MKTSASCEKKSEYCRKSDGTFRLSSLSGDKSNCRSFCVLFKSVFVFLNSASIFRFAGRSHCSFWLYGLNVILSLALMFVLKF